MMNKDDLIDITLLKENNNWYLISRESIEKLVEFLNSNGIKTKIFEKRHGRKKKI